MVTIKDIARECNVSTATVSKALNGYEDIGSDTVERIRKTAQEMHYRPNSAARMLKTNISHNIGVVFLEATESGIGHEYFSKILNSAKDEAEHLGYDITFISKTIGNSSFVEHCKYRRCDGVLVVSVGDFMDPAVTELIRSSFPTVVIDYTFNNHSSILSDNVEGSYSLTKYLIENGHRRIGMIHGERTSVTEKRISGFYKACQEYGIEIKDDYVLEGRYHSPEAAAEATHQLMTLKEKPTAIMYSDDFAAIGGMNVLEEMGISIPEDVSVTGYDGITLSQVMRPKLTTWYQDTDKIGRASARKLVENIENRKSCIAEQILVHGRLLEGRSVKKIK